MPKVLNPKKLREIIHFYPFPAQQEILTNLKRFNIICAGRRFGKTILCAWLCLLYAMTNNKTIWVVAPTYELSKRVFEYLTLWIGKYFHNEGFKVNFASLEIFYGSSKIACKSAEVPNQLLGSGLDLLIIDEASRVGKNVWESYLRASLSDKEGTLIAISTPFGKESWFYDLFLRGKSGDENWKSFSFASKENPYLSVKDLEEARNTLPKEVYEQEFEGKFLESSARVFRGVDKIVKEDILRMPEPDKFYVLGVDLGRQRDYTCLTCIDKSNHRVVYWDRFSGVDWGFQKERISSVAIKYNNAKIVIDSTGLGSPIAQDLREVGVFIEDFCFSNQTKKELIEKLRIFIEQERVFIPNNEILINELESFGYDMTPSGNIIYSAPQGQHDDCVISLALAVKELWHTAPLPDKSFLQKRAERMGREGKRQQIIDTSI